MKVLAVSDIESPSLYDYFSPEKVEGVELIVGCGDLRMEYLEFLVTMMNVPLIYIHGNHDDHFRREPEGCICIDDDVFEYKGLRFVGLGGSIRYKEGKYMFTEREMRSRIRKLWWKIRRHKGFDVLVTHSPARHINDFDNVTHRGFECFNELLDRYKGDSRFSNAVIKLRNVLDNDETILMLAEYKGIERSEIQQHLAEIGG